MAKKKPRVPTPPRSDGPQKKQASASPLLTRNRVLAVAGVAAAIAIALVAASLLGSRGDGGGGAPDTITGAADAEAMLDGIAQDGNVLGDPDAPVTLVEYADLQCPFCAEWARASLPALVDEYVRDGDLRIEFRGLTFIGEDSEDALRAALSAGEQEKLWNIVDLLYRNQGEENSGWVDDELLRAVGNAVPDLDVEEMMKGRDADSVTQAIAGFADQAAASGVQATPTFEIGETGGQLSPLQVSSLGPADFRTAIDDLLNG